MTVGIWGAGLIGRSLAAELVRRGLEVHILNRSVGKPLIVKGRSPPMRYLSFSADEDEMRVALDGISVLVHCAGSGVDHHDQFMSAAERLATLSKQVGLKRVLMLSTVGVYGNALANVGLIQPFVVEKSLPPLPVSPYAKSRYQAEISMRERLIRDGVEFSAVRVPMVIGCGMNAKLFIKLRRLLDLGLFPALGGPSACLPCIRAERLADGLASLVVKPHLPESVYQFAESLKWATVLESHSRMTGGNIYTVPMPGHFLFRLARFLGAEQLCSLLRIMINEVVYADDSAALISNDSCAVSASCRSKAANDLYPDDELSTILWT